MDERRRKIFIIADQAEESALLRRVLKQDAACLYDLLEEGSHKAIETCFAEQPDCILLDYRLIEANALTVINELNPVPLAPVFPIILMVNAGEEKIGAKAARNGAQDFLVKGNFSTDELCLSIERAIEIVWLRKEHKRSSAALSESQLFKQNTLETAPGVFYTFDIESKTSTYLTEQAAKALGCSPDELRRPPFDFLQSYMHPEDLPRVTEHFDNISKARNGEIFEFEYRMRHHSGDWRWFRSRDKVFRRGETGKVKEILGVAIDITERKQAEKALRESEEMLRLALDSADTGIHIWNIAENTLHWDKRLRHFWSLSPEDVVDYKVFINGLHPEDRDKTQIAVDRALDPKGNGKYFAEYRVIGKNDGLTRWISATGQVFFENDIPARLIGTACDITDDKIAEEQLRRSEANLRLATGAAQMYSWELDLETQIISFGDNFSQVVGFGASASDMKMSETYEKLIYPDDSEKVAHYIEQVIGGNVAFPSLELRLVNPGKNGSIVWIETTSYMARDELGRPLRVVGVSQNITDRKRNEERLRESNAVLTFINLNTPTLIYVKDLESRIQSANPATVAVIGKSLTEIIGKNHAEYMNDEAEGEVIRANDLRTIRDGKTETFEETVETASGRHIFLSTKTPYRNEGGEIIGLIGISIDITERKREEEELRESELKLRQMADAMPQVVWIADPNGSVYYYNRRVKDFEGIDQAAEGLWNWQPILHPDDMNATVEAWQRAVREKKPYAKEHRIMMKSGGYRWHLSRGFPVFDAAGEISRWYGTATDINDLKEAEVGREELLAREQILRREAEAANRSKDEFLAMLSHELRSPLNAMYGWIRILQTNDLDAEKTRHAIEVIARNVVLQNALIEDLLDVSRIISDKMRLESERVSLNSILQSTVEAARPTAEKHGVNIVLNPEPTAEQIIGDKHRLQQIINNLLTNAIKFTPAGGWINVELRRQGDRAKLTVQDSGIGIEPELLPQIFERFKQADASSVRKFGGLGLGLAIVKHLVELHGGSISAHSDGTDKGTTFIIKLPLATPGITKADLEFAPNYGGTNNNNNVEETNLLANLRILVVDDDCDALDLMCFALESQGAKAVCVNSAGDALLKLEKEQFDLLISDLGMSGMDGYDLISQVRLKENGKAEMLPAIALTGYVSADDRARVLAAGYQKHLSKPVDIEKLPTLILSFLKKD